ncbi:type IV toxin-antitoxin system AbiEi family antitoxin domain-containing protein [Nocardioides sp. MAHUQ-72]|uniref:type IV toxin-antitoxin system AbiEi family antitoxin domain-containing protein n=1 Tax=unclassified Nocardioides TaxID=2615069 RepID=UPI003606811C
MDIHRFLGQPFLDDSFPLPLDAPFTTRQARREGVVRDNLTRLCKEGLLRRVLQGVYVATQAGDSIPLRAQALGLVVPEDSVICDRHAGWLHGATMVLRPNEHLELMPISVFRPSGNGRLRNGLAASGERNLTAEDVVELHGLRVTTPLRTAWDLGRVRWPEPAISALDAMLRLNLFTHEELLADVERFRRMRWVTTLRAMAPLADGRSESPGESILRLRWLGCLLATPIPQYEIFRGGRLLARLDLACPELHYGAEYDGEEWHSSPEQQAHDRTRRAEVSAEDWLVQPFTSSNLFGRDQNCEELLITGAREARRRFGRRIA